MKDSPGHGLILGELALVVFIGREGPDIDGLSNGGRHGGGGRELCRTKTLKRGRPRCRTGSRSGRLNTDCIWRRYVSMQSG